MRNALIALLALAGTAFAGPVSPTSCPNCILNTASPQDAQVNLGTGTIRGTLTVSTLNVTNLNITNLTATNIAGSGAAITALNASALASGTVPSARVAGAYAGITGVGTLAAGVWQGTPVGTQYGGTGQNFVSASTGSIPYFDNVGHMAALPASTATRILQTNGPTAAPSWTGSPQVLGTNITGIPLANLLGGTLPHNIAVDTNSIASVNGAGVLGNIPGGAAFLTAPMSISNLIPSTLPTTIAASSITPTGVTAGTWGGPTFIPQLVIHADGRVYAVTQSTLAVPPVIITPGSLPAGVLIDPSAIQPGAFGPLVRVSSLNATGLQVGAVGSAAQTLSAVRLVDGRLSSLTAQNIALPADQLTAGLIPSGVVLPAAQIDDGTLGAAVLAQNLTPNGVSSGTFGGSGQLVQITVDEQGRATSVSQFPIPSFSTNVVLRTVDNNWAHAQTHQSSITVNADILAQNITASGYFNGIGLFITNLNPANVDPGTLGPSVVASSIAFNTVADAQVAPGANIAQAKIAGLSTSFAAKASSGTNTDLTNLNALVSATASGQISAGGFTTPGASTAAYFYGSGAFLSGIATGACSAYGGSILCQGVSNTVGSSTNVVSGGEANSISAGSFYSTIGGGNLNSLTAQTSVIAGGISNTGSAQRSVIGGGDSNTNSGVVGVIGGGVGNTVSGTGGVVGGGQGNSSGSGIFSAIDGGQFNTIGGGATYATIGGGDTNAISGANYGAILGGGHNTVSQSYSVIAGGFSNTTPGAYSFVGGGNTNAVGGQYSVIGGGLSNTTGNNTSVIAGGDSNSSTGQWSSIPGGSLNVANGDYSFAAGRRCKATAQGAFCLSDSTALDFTNAVADSIRLRFQGGFYVQASSASIGADGVTRSTFTGAALDMGDFLNLKVHTKAEFDTITPKPGDRYQCSDCTVPYDVCVGTAATLSGFRAETFSAISTVVPGTLVPKGCGTNE